MEPNHPSKAATPTRTSFPTNVGSSPSKYVPQFSASTELILKRINAGGGASNLSSLGITGTSLPSGYEDMKRNVMSSMKTSMNMEIPSAPATKSTKRNNGSRASVSSSQSASVSKPATPGTSTATQRNGGSAGRGRKSRTKAGQKRKRGKQETSDEESEEEDSDAMSKLGGDSDSDASEEITAFPKVTQSGRQVVKPAQFVPEVRDTPARKRGPSKKSQEMALCKRCGRGHSPDNNMIVFCDGCDGGWHQMCHDPPVSNDAVKDEDAPWFCLECTQTRNRKSESSAPSAVVSNSHSVPPSNASNANVPNAPPSLPPASPSPHLISWEDRSSDAKRAYFSSLSQHSLISLLMQATAIHPDLPIFPSHNTGSTAPVYISPFARPPSIPPPPTTYIHQSQQNYNYRPHSQPQNNPFPASATSGLFTRAESNPNAPMNFIRKIAPLPTSAKNTPKNNSKPGPAPKFNKEARNTNSAPPTLQVQPQMKEPMNEDDDSRESTPPSPPYPKAGNGLMAKLGPDDEDIEWLVDDGDYVAFSQSVFGTSSS